MPDTPSPIYPTFDTIDECLTAAKEKLPIETDNELFWVVQVVLNTIQHRKYLNESQFKRSQ